MVEKQLAKIVTMATLTELDSTYESNLTSEQLIRQALLLRY
jgi:ABC-type Fe3+-citrate transport system substrate-binding protein